MDTRMIYESDPWLEPWKSIIDSRHRNIQFRLNSLADASGHLSGRMNNHLYYGLHRTDNGWVFREYAPNASKIFLLGDFNNWKRNPSWELHACGNGDWEIRIPDGFLSHGQLYKLFIEWPGGGGERIPSYVTRCIQDAETKLFCAQVWNPSEPYSWKNGGPGPRRNPLVYECHIGMSSDQEKVATFEEFRENVLPRVKKLGYDTLQIMALQEHPYYGSFGYQVSNFFALSSRFGTPEEFKRLVDEAHGMGIAVIMDIVHSHSVDNELEGLGMFDGREDLYFHFGPAGRHPAWGSRCFDYGKNETCCFLLSNLKFWMEEYHLDGFRFDGVTSMIYWDHGLGKDFGNYELYFNSNVDESALGYLVLANVLVHELNPDAITIAEDVSGLAGLAAPFAAGGIGFDFRMSMGVADHWIKWIKERDDWDWSMGEIWYELTRKREDESTISYAECHDQAMVGDKTIIFRLLDALMYDSMSLGSQNILVDRGIALHKMIRLLTLATAGDGYLNFMGNEFGHPEWIDFPREGNGWSFKYARRQWQLVDNPDLRYAGLNAWDAAMINLAGAEGFLSEKPSELCANEGDKVLVVCRKNCIFAFNFNPSESFVDYGFEAPSGNYAVVLDSDRKEFGGFSRVDDEVEHLVVDGRLKLYLPSRCVVVLKKIEK
ncbi:MAG: alpha amylase C-terminal domain-containing protein [Bacteroidales bacterium]|nr:alpha amylase C-terminal domain-containing protein [Candidatus Hennigimonas equi]